MKEVIKVSALVLFAGSLVVLAAVRHHDTTATPPSPTQLRLDAAYAHINQLESQVTNVTTAAATEKTNLCAYISQHVNAKTTPIPTDCQ